MACWRAERVVFAELSFRLKAGDAALLLLDEPTLGLDTASVQRFGAMLAEHRAGGGIVLAATHLPLPLPGAVTLELT